MRLDNLAIYFPFVALGIAAFGCAWWGWNVATTATKSGKGWFLAFVAFLLIVASPTAVRQANVMLGIAALIGLLGFAYGSTQHLRKPEAQQKTKTILVKICGMIVVYIIGHEVWNFGIPEVSVAAIAVSIVLGQLNYTA